MTEDPLLNMWISFFAMGLMFVSVVITIFAKEKLKGVFRYILLTFSFICIVISGLIVFLSVFSGPTESAMMVNKVGSVCKNFVQASYY